ncbi:MAG: hypothetical protein R3F65_31520 [bacterium]
MYGDPPATVEDHRGAVHRLGAKLGQGAQGAVFATDDPRRVVKLLAEASAPARTALAARFARIRRLDLDELHLARPLELLAEPHVGYVMELLDEMQPLTTLMRPRGALMPWHVETGGLRRRLRLLAHAGEALTGLHARGLAYVDPSPRNVFVSTDLDHDEAWLIDTDNISVAGHGEALYTPSYGAPELVAGHGSVSTLSDAHAFAVIAFEALALTHPLIGDAIDQGEPELEDEAFEGRWPWIDDPDDDRNRSSCGIPRAWVLSPLLGKLAHRTFGPGLLDRLARPSVREWVEALHQAADATVACKRCGATFYLTSDRCPSPGCGAAAPAVVFGEILNGWIHDDDPDKRRRVDPPRRGVIAVTDTGFAIQRRHLTGRTEPAAREVICTLRRMPRGLEICADSDVPVAAINLDGRHVDLGPRPRIIPLDRRDIWRLHLGDRERLHRVIEFADWPEGQR